LWIIFPFFLSILVLVVPAADINRMLRNYRNGEELKLRNKCRKLREEIEAEGVNSSEREEKRIEYDYLCSRREEVHKMRTWPYSLGATTSFAGAFISNIVLAVELARSFI